MKRPDRLLLVLLALLAGSIAAFLLGVIDYPVGFIVLSVLIVARILYLRSGGER